MMVKNRMKLIAASTVVLFMYLMFRLSYPGPSGSGSPGVQILISSYRRSGSTFLGRVIGWNADSFYWYEPFVSLYESKYFQSDGTICDYVRPDCTRLTELEFEKTVQPMLGLIKDIFNCNFAGHISWITAMERLHKDESRVGHSWEEFRKCRNLKRVPPNTECLEKIIPVCRQAKYRLIKQLRMNLKLSSRLLTEIPNLKIIHLFRDPRGQLNSHIHTSWYNVKEGNIKQVENDIIVLCDRMRKDLKTARTLLNTNPDQFKIVQYEDFDDPVYKSRKLYEFLGMEFNDQTRELIDNLLPVGAGDGAGFHPNSYRDSLLWTSVRLVNQHCSDVYQDLGYTTFNTETELRDHNMSALLGPLPYSLG